MKRLTGFSLIELMIVIAIIAILASLAIPSYSAYVVRSKVTEAIQVGKSIGTEILNYYNTNGSMPASLAAMNLTSTSYNTNYITSIAYSPTSGGLNNNSAALVTISLNPTTVGTAAGTSSNLYFGFKQSTGSQLVITQCGQSSAGVGVDTKYLSSSGCNSTTVNAFATSP